jgi:F0F1-type ATP synthase membrane subunit c/vacuolar-type H+-ATPase subunit K
MAVLLIIAGLVIGFGGFCFAAVNMGRNVGSPHFDFDNTVRRHMGASIIMGFGTLIFAIGIVIAIANYLSRMA